MGFLKIRKKDDIIVNYKTNDYVEIDNDTHYVIEYDYTFLTGQPFYFYKWDSVNLQVIINDNRYTYDIVKIEENLDNSTVTIELNSDSDLLAIENIEALELLRLSSTKRVKVYGIPRSLNNHRIMLYNYGLNDIQFIRDSGSSLSGNRLKMSNNRYTLKTGSCTEFFYDVVSGYWVSIK